jgi:hypothetical protein
LTGKALRDAYEELCLNEVQAIDGPMSASPIQLTPCNEIEDFLVEGGDRFPGSLSWVQARSIASSSLIAGFELDNDSKVATQNLEQYEYFCRRLVESFRDRGPESFDRWLRLESGKGFVRLLPGHKKMGAEARGEAKALTRRFYLLQLWKAYQVMSRCVGALMRIIWLDFCKDQALNPTTVEKQLFSQMHMPQFFLGGLPLAFLGGPQIGWIVRPLLNFWRQEEFGPRGYDALTKLFWIYADLGARRRETDREIKARTRAAERNQEEWRKSSEDHSSGPPKEGDAIWQRHRDSTDAGYVDQCICDAEPLRQPPESYPELVPPAICARCKTKLHLVRTISRIDEHWFLVEVACGHCDEQSRIVRIEPEKWPRER